MIPMFRVAMAPEAPAMAAEVLSSGMIGQGAKVEEFERGISAKIGGGRAVTVNSATSGLHLALHLLAAAPGGPATLDQGGGEVLTTPLTMEATNWTILANRLRPKWVDIDPATLNVDLDDLARKITPSTRAIVVVHFAGYPVDLDRLAAVLDRAEQEFGFRPAVIEDCAHAWGARYRGAPVGSHGNTCVFSFQAVKHLTTGDGGAVVLPTEELDARARRLRWFGIDRTADRLRNPPDVAEWGYKFHMTDLNAAIGLGNLEPAEAVVARHKDNAAFFDRELAGVPGVELTERAPEHESSFWVYPMKVEDRSGFLKRMDEAGIMAGSIHEPNDRHTAVREFRSLLPGLERVAPRIAGIPVGSWVTGEQREYIARTVQAGW